MYEYKLSILSSALFLAGLCQPVWAVETTDVGTVGVVGEGGNAVQIVSEDELGTGLIVEETGTKTRSTVTKAAIAKAAPTANPYQLLNLLPSVNATSIDGTGLFGGTFNMRGFAADQLGFTVNGAPVNDSGNFAVYPQEYVDNENLCELFVTQGSVDTEAPHVGASGGNIGIVTCDPKDEMGAKLSQSFGSINFRRTYLRGDTGWLGNAKFFLSYSKTEADKFRGPGKADREHVDVGAVWKISEDTMLKSSLLYNRAINNHFNFLNTRADYEQGTDKVNDTVVPQHDGDTDSDFNWFGGNGMRPFYKYSVNPFENALWTANLISRINDKLTLSANPYYWYGYGTGGIQETRLNISPSFDGSLIGGGIKNPYSQYPNAKRVGVYSSSLTETSRPGVTFKANYELDNHRILAGLWLERAKHEQTRPATTVDNNGNIADKWLNNHLVRRWDGSLYQRRDRKTTTTASTFFLNDEITVSDDWIIQPGMRYMSTKRKLEMFANDSESAADYTNEKKYVAFLPSLGATYQVDPAWQIYGNVAKNQRIPNNYALFANVSADYVDGKPTNVSVTYNENQQPEKSTNYEMGVRYVGDLGTASLAVFNVDFKNRQASGYSAASASTYALNVGDSTTRGLEFQGGTRPYHGWSLFSSATYTSSKIDNDYLVADRNGNASYLATDGKDMPLAPRWMAGLGVQFTKGPFLATLTGKYTDKQYTTLLNDDYVDDYTLFDLTLAYQLPSSQIFKSPKIQLNVVNLFNEDYLITSTSNGSDIKTTINSSVDSANGGTPNVYQGARRFISLTVSTEF